MKLANWLELSPMIALGIVVLICAIVWYKKLRVNPYDMRTLNAAPPEPIGEAYDDMVTADSGPYCHSCDEPFHAGTYRCTHCGRPLG